MLLDVLETLSESMPKSFILHIKDQKLPLKKALESLFFRSQQYIALVCNDKRLESEEEEDDDVS